MLLKDIQPLVDKGAKKPLFLFFDTYKQVKEQILPNLKSLAPTIEEGTSARAHVDRLISELEKDVPDEHVLATSLLFFSEIFAGKDIPSEAQDVVARFVPAARAFASRAEKTSHYKKKREELKSSLSADEQQKHDVRLFENEGMMYCLEFYLALYKRIVDAPTEEEKRRLIESTHIDLGFGDLPGLWHDVKQDEILGKFVLNILDDTVRETLVRAYYDLKDVVMNINISCDKQENCMVTYNDTSVEDVGGALKAFLQSLMNVYTDIGVMQLKSYFFRPYGESPMIGDIVL